MHTRQAKQHQRRYCSWWEFHKGWVTFAATVALLVLLVGRVIFSQYQEQKQRYITGELTNFETKVTSVTGVYKRFSGFIFDDAINTPEVADIVRRAWHADKKEQNRLRDELYTLLEDKYLQYKMHHFRQLHFHFANGDSFLRMHKPLKYGDNLFDVRETVRIANTEKRFVESFEEGRIFNGYRFVYPLRSEHGHIGSVEISLSMSTVINALSELYPSPDFYFIVSSKAVQAKVFADMKSNYLLSTFSHQYVFDKEVYQSSEADLQYNRYLEELVLRDHNIQRQIDSGMSFGTLISLPSHTLIASFLSIKNMKGDHVAYLISITQDDTITTFHQVYYIMALLILVLSTLSVVMVFTRERNRLKFIRLSETDYLTRLYTRGKFNDFAGYEFERAGRTAGHFSILMLDIDFFKKVNDHYGHNAGDKVLRKLSKLLSSRIRESDVLARWGGEEFICLLPETSEEQGLILAEHLRHLIGGHYFEQVGSLSISLGVAEYHPEDNSLEEIIERADQALYYAKACGRNRSCSWHEVLTSRRD